MDAPDETRTFPHGQVEVVKIGGATISRYTFEPGHDGWVVGDEAVRSVEFSGAEGYAKSG